MQVYENVPLKPYTSMKVGGPARYFITIDTLDDLQQACAFAKDKTLPIHVLGGGSNTIFVDKGFDGVVLYMRLPGVTIADQFMTVAAGENWDKVVDDAVKAGLSGIEALSLIPGTFGGAIVQNIGAYGQELGEVVEYVDAFSVKEGRRIRMTAQECAFAYRESIFKYKQRGNFIVIGAMLKLKKSSGKLPPHKDIVDFFSAAN